MRKLNYKEDESLNIEDKKIMNLIEQSFKQTGTYPTYRMINLQTNLGLPQIFECVSKMSQMGYIQKDDKGKIIGAVIEINKDNNLTNEPIEINESIKEIEFVCLVEKKEELWNEIFDDEYVLNDNYGIIMMGSFDNNFVNIKVKYNDNKIYFPVDMHTIMRQIMFEEELIKICNLTLQGFNSII